LEPITDPPPPPVVPDPAVAFGTPELSPSLASTSQTLSPDGKVLSLLFAGLSAQAQASGTRGAVAAGSLAVPLTGVTSPVFIKIVLSGSAAILGAGASGRLDVQLNGFGVGTGFAADTPIQQALDLQLGSDVPIVILNLVLSSQVCGADAAGSALVALDTVDLTIQLGS
jgi:hypothetical protein